jgi:Mrp family chromosome partitioning ATPase
MSRNFELLHEAGKVQELLRQRLVEQAGPTPILLDPGTPALQIEGRARDEVSKLVQRLFLTPGPRRPRQVVFAGIEPGSGSSWVAAHAADILASQVQGSVCVVDCDAVSPSLHRAFKVQNHYGLADALLGGEPIRQYVQQLTRPNLWLLSCGLVNEKSQQMLTLEAMRRRMSELRAEFDYVLLDAAPISASNHCAVLGSWCDGIALVLRANFSSRKTARQVLKDLEAANAPVIGAVLNQRTFPIPEGIYNRLSHAPL